MTQGINTVAEHRATRINQSKLPEEIAFLSELASNFYWSWNASATTLFRDISPTIWEEIEQNPSELLRRISELRLRQVAIDEDFIARLKTVEAEYRSYMAEPIQTFEGITKENPVAYFCAEYGVHNSLPIYSGGLGILSGDHLKSSSDLNVPLIAVGLLYRYGYFRQKIAHDGWQEERYLDVFDQERALFPVVDGNGDRVLIEVELNHTTVVVQAWLARIGRISLYLLDTNIEDNSPDDRLITGHLYGGDRETRILQEKVLGIGGVKFLRELKQTPSVFHLNEGHSAFLTLELTKEAISLEPNLSFEEAAAKVRQKCVFTTHTPVAAGNDEFAMELIDEYFSDKFLDALKISRNDFHALGRTNPEDTSEWFGMTPLAIRMARKANGVSKKHGDVSRELWHKMFPEVESAEAVPITHITNGVHPSTWVAPALAKIFRKHIGNDWIAKSRTKDSWESAVNSIPAKELWQVHGELKGLLIAFIRERTKRRLTGQENTINEHKDTSGLLDPNALTIGFARRVAAYKRWDLIMHDLDRLLRMINDKEHPVQFVFAGKAHPQDRTAKQILQSLMKINHDSNWQNRAVFIEDYDQEIARYMVHGVDVWMNVPRRPLEASGTSGQKVAMNGGLNFSVLDGWWIEGFNGTNGFAIGGEDDASAETDQIDEEDANSLYEMLEETIIREFYDRFDSGIPEKWVERMKNSIATLTNQFSSDRMVADYFKQIYEAK